MSDRFSSRLAVLLLLLSLNAISCAVSDPAADTLSGNDLSTAPGPTTPLQQDLQSPHRQSDVGDDPEPGTDTQDSVDGVMQSDADSPCVDVTCGGNASCNPSSGKCVCKQGTTGDPNVACTAVPPPTSWIGSPCVTHDDCPYSGGFCMTDGEGFLDGHCSMACEKFCPDSAGFPTTFCIAMPSDTDGHCFSQCDTGKFPANKGCRAGYSCRSWPRVSDPGTVKKVCVPSEWVPDVTEPKCSDLSNPEQDDECYLDMISFGDAQLRALTLKLLQGSASAVDALNWLDLNHLLSQSFIETVLKATIHNNYTAGHSSSKPMRGMIVHYTAAQSEDSTIKYFVSASPHASTHFIVGSKRNGLIVQLFSHTNRTWHAGSTYNIDRFGFDFANAGFLDPVGPGFEDYYSKPYAMVFPVFGNNPVKIADGIPEPNTPKNKYTNKKYWQPYTYYQVVSWLIVARALNLTYGLQYDAIERHGDVASSRVDPGPALPLTLMKPLAFSNDAVWSIEWLNDYKWESEWIELHPEAR